MARIFKALSDENRILILKQLRNGEKCGCELLEELNITQPTLSHHMKILCECDIVNNISHSLDYLVFRLGFVNLETFNKSLKISNFFVECHSFLHSSVTDGINFAKVLTDFASIAYALSMYSPVRVSILRTSPMLMKSGTLI